ncbi:hypothetical protein [Borrelia crocidurae]|uniref:Uncharacterized protein n=1 Tax=Borrelia crocidurae (strain Achema) TaxID=1155096 RepID=I0FEJ8_BORCA|nr:hypothetical protein [Borrelia crocidurae]AFI31904.1 hypothetical protein Q7M_1448 [Borrelia crocidurae str. Achema]
MSRNILMESSGTYYGDIVKLAKNGLEDLIPYKIISKDDLRDGYYVVRKKSSRSNVTTGFGDYINEIGMSSNPMQEATYKMHRFDTLQRISQHDLMHGTISEDEVRSHLESNLMENAFDSVVFGRPSIKMEGIATLSGRTKLTATQASSLTTGITLHQKVVEAKRKSEEYKKKIGGAYILLLPHKFSHLLLDLYSEPQYITVNDALIRDHKIITSVLKGLEHPVLYEPDASVMFMPFLSEIYFRKFSAADGEYIIASMESAGVVHFHPEEVVEITITS